MSRISYLINQLFPKQCINCSSVGAYLCKDCKRKLLPHPEICPYCHKVSKDYVTCIDCRTDKNNYLEGIMIPFAYTDIIKKLIIKLKYFHKKDISGFLWERLSIALQINETFQRHTAYNKVFITYVPTHRYREHFIKGYNQSKILAKKLSEQTHIPRKSISKKQKHTKTQASLDRNSRLNNLKNVFSLIKNLSLLGNETLLIVDDITTTGSTINELAKLVKNHYPKIKIRWAVLGRHIG